MFEFEVEKQPIIYCIAGLGVGVGGQYTFEILS